MVLHEAGHGLGLSHSSVYGAVMMSSTAFGVHTGLHADDVAGIRALYGPDSGGELPPPPGEEPTISADRFEANDSLGNASNFGTVNSVSETGLTVHSSADADFFSFTTRRSGTYTVSLTQTQVGGNLDLVIYDWQGTLLSGANSVSTNESLTLTLSGGRAYTAKVFSPTGDLNSYDLAITKLSGKPGKGGGYLRLDGFGADTSGAGVGTVAGHTPGGSGNTKSSGEATAVNLPTSVADDGAEQSHNQSPVAVEFAPADGPGVLRSQALRLLMELDSPGRDWSDGPPWARAG